MDREFQQRLEAEAIARTQGLNEPVTDYIISLRAILDKMVIGWDEVKKIRLLYQNMLPSIKKQIRYDQIHSELTLVRLAREAEKLAIDKNQYRPPPPLGQAVFPELAYKEDPKQKAP